MANRPQAAGLLALLAAGVYVMSLGYGFVWDDRTVVVGDESVHSVSSIPGFFVRSYWARSDPDIKLYRPVTVSTFALDWAVGGGSPVPFHVTNLLLHVAATLLVFLLLLELEVAHPTAFLAAALFAVHPVHTEVVDSIVGRAEMLAAIGVLAGFWAAVRGKYLLLAIAFAVGLLSKENAGMLPVLLIAWHLLGDRRKRARWPAYAVQAAVVLVYALARWHALGTLTRSWTLIGERPYAERLVTMGVVFADYARLLVCPWPLCADYAVNMNPAARVIRIEDPRFVLAVVVLGVLFAAWAIAALRRRPSAAWGAWIPLALFPVSNLLVATGYIEAERFLYLPSVGACVLLAGPFVRWKGVGWGVVGVFLLLTLFRNPVWTSDEALLDSRVADAPDNPFPCYFRARAYLEKGQPELARPLLDHALALRPEYMAARELRAAVLSSLGDLAGAERDLDVVLDAHPDWSTGRLSLALIYGRTGRLSMVREQDLPELALYHASRGDRRAVTDVLQEMDRRGAPADEDLLFELELRLRIAPK